MRPTPSSSAGPVGPISLVALGIALALGLARGQASGEEAFFLQPSRAEAGAAFTVKLLSPRYDCEIAYSHQSVDRQGNQIHLRFLAQPREDVACLHGDRPYGPSFTLPALPAGRYDVHAAVMSPCHVTTPVCKKPYQIERVGILTVGARSEADWFIQPVSVPAGKAFDLRILSERYGNCHTSFSHAQLTVDAHRGADNRLLAAFVIETDSTRVCVVDVHPHGTAFPVEGLTAGRWPVFVVETPACVYQTPVCPWLPPEETARVVDTLLVTGSTALEPGAPPSQGAGVRPRTRFAGGRLRVELPAGWAPGVLTLSDARGRVVAQGVARGGTDEVFDRRELPAGLLFLRVESRGGVEVLSLVAPP